MNKDQLRQERHMLFKKIAIDWAELSKHMDRLIEIEFEIEELEYEDRG